MTNEMKLLMAFIDASGFEVKTVLDYQECEIPKSEGVAFITRSFLSSDHDYCKLKTNTSDGVYTRGENGSYFKMLIRPKVSYKVTKRL